MTRETPAFHETVRAEDIVRLAEELGYEILEMEGKVVEIIIVGEQHENPMHIEAEAELIKKMKPGLVMTENLDSGDVYDPISDTVTYFKPEGKISGKKLRSMSKAVAPILTIAQKLGIRIIGCDLSTDAVKEKMAELDQKPTLSLIQALEILLHAAREGPAYAQEHDYAISPEGERIRDDHIINEILTSAYQAQQPILIIVGDSHVTNFQQRKLLMKRGIGYIILRPRPETYIRLDDTE